MQNPFKIRSYKGSYDWGAYIEIEPYIGHHWLVQRVRKYTNGVKWAEKLGDLAQVSEQLSHH